MVELGASQVDRVFHALADSTRRQILGVLTRKDATVSELAAPFDMSLAAVSKHVKVLEGARLVNVVKRGRSRVCSVEPHGLRTAAEIIDHYERFWTKRLDGLDAHLKQRANEKKQKKIT